MLRRLLVFVLAISCLSAPLGATWSIIVINRRTGEVAVASATCISLINLIRGLPVIVVGTGGGVIQASGSSTGLPLIADGLRNGDDPVLIMELVKDNEFNAGVLQSAIVAFEGGDPATFTGNGVGGGKEGIIGESGDLVYAIQGNVLTGKIVVTMAEEALLATEGDLGQKVLAAMQAARDFGGDGRCSCDLNRPTMCGAPPDEFEKSAHVGFILLARMGDPDADCSSSGTDCANVKYYLKLNVRGLDSQPDDPDPVDQLTEKYETWRLDRLGRPDGILSTIESVQALPADGVTQREVTVRLVDIDGVPLMAGGADVQVSTIDGETPIATTGPVTDHGDGTYSFTLTAGLTEGLDRFAVTATDDFLTATLYPYLEIRSDAPRPLHVGYDQVSANAGATVPFVVTEPTRPGATYLLLASITGTTPGIPVAPNVILPLHPDHVTFRTFTRAGDPRYLPGTRGNLDLNGRAEAALTAPPTALLPLAGVRMDWAGLLMGKGGVAVTNAVGFEVLP